MSLTEVREGSEEGSLSDLLKVLLGVPATSPVYATSSFRFWGGAEQLLSWPPPERPGGVLLVDTRDRAVRRDPVALAIGAAGSSRFDAALILTGSGRPGSAVKRAVRRIIFPGTQRLPEERVAAGLDTVDGNLFVHRLSFDDDLDVPAGFHVIGKPQSTGTAFLLTRAQPFSGGLWTKIANWLNSPEIAVESFQLRVRGAAVVMLRAGEGRFVIRLVPPGTIQQVISRNFYALVELRASLRGSSLLDRIPTPAFAQSYGDALVLGETRLEGELAWRVAKHDELASVLHTNALAFLDQLRGATGQSHTLAQTDLRERLTPDEMLVASSHFVRQAVRELLARELADAVAALEGKTLLLHTSHGDFGYGNILADDKNGTLTGVIDWDTARQQDFPGIDRVNLEIQVRRSLKRESFATAVEGVWRERSAHEALQSENGQACVRALFGLAVCRYIIRSFHYPAVYAKESAGFERALRWLSRTGRQA